MGAEAKKYFNIIFLRHYFIGSYLLRAPTCFCLDT